MNHGNHEHLQATRRADFHMKAKPPRIRATLVSFLRARGESADPRRAEHKRFERLDAMVGGIADLD
jgi:hypothetical protein